MHLTEVLPSHQRGQGQLSKDSPHRDRAEPCQPLSLQAPQSSKKQQLQPSLRTHTDCAGFQAVQPWPEMPRVGEVGGF